MTREARSEKVLVLGIDGMDPVLSKYHMEQGIMPNLKKLIEAGTAREDLMLLGSHPTITPPMWTSLATGCHPYVHGITDFWLQNPEKLDTFGYALHSGSCKAEQLWNVTAEAGMKTLVWHWPGSSWPPTSDSPNLMVVDGTQPEGVNMGTGEVEHEFIAYASVQLTQVTYRAAVGGGEKMCVITDLEIPGEEAVHDDFATQVNFTPDLKLINPPGKNAMPPLSSFSPYDVTLSPVKAPTGWEIEVPADAKEAIFIFSKGLIRRPALILKNENGIYDHVTIYKNKKSEETIVTLYPDQFVPNIVDEAIKNDVHYTVNRSMRILQLAEDGSELKMFVSAAVDIHDNKVWHPKELHAEICEKVGYPQPVTNISGKDYELMSKVTHASWLNYMKWQADCLNYMIEKNDVDMIFSHVHNDDAEKHNFFKWCGEEKRANELCSYEQYEEVIANVSRQNDMYIGEFLHLLDKGWSILLVSDHGLTVAPTYQEEFYNDISIVGINTGYMVDWGFTELLRDEEGDYIGEIDWANTKAIMTRLNNVYINLKGRWPNGIVEPEDKWELEEQIMTKLYQATSPNGKRLCSLALRAKDAIHLGLGGPECGDIILFQNDDFTAEHGGGMSTALGLSHTSQSPIFVAAGKGIKQGEIITRVVRTIDIAPTVAVLAGVRMPKDAEGAPAYQIFAEEF